MTSLEREGPFDNVLEADEGELGETIDFSGVAHGGDEMTDSVVGAEVDQGRIGKRGRRGEESAGLLERGEKRNGGVGSGLTSLDEESSSRSCRHPHIVPERPCSCRVSTRGPSSSVAGSSRRGRRKGIRQLRWRG